MSYRIGAGYLGSSAIETSVANAEVLPSAPAGWSTGYSLYRFSFINESACTVKINGGDPVYIRAWQGFNIDEKDTPITSFVICENDILYNYVGAF